MIKTCRACGSPGVAVMSFDYGERRIWLDDLSGPVDVPDVVLCTNHADSRTPPVGWMLTDRRLPARHLFVAVDVA